MFCRGKDLTLRLRVLVFIYDSVWAGASGDGESLTGMFRLIY